MKREKNIEQIKEKVVEIWQDEMRQAFLGFDEEKNSG